MIFYVPNAKFPQFFLNVIEIWQKHDEKNDLNINRATNFNASPAPEGKTLDPPLTTSWGKTQSSQ